MAAKTTTKKTTKAAAKTTTRKRTPAKKAEPKTSPQAEPKTPAKKEGLRKPQLRVLATLAKVKTLLSRKEVSEKAKVDKASLTEYLGSADEETRLANDAKHFKSLVSYGYVKQEVYVVEDREVVHYKITAAGRKAAKG